MYVSSGHVCSPQHCNVLTPQIQGDFFIISFLQSKFCVAIFVIPRPQLLSQYGKSCRRSSSRASLPYRPSLKSITVQLPDSTVGPRQARWPSLILTPHLAKNRILTQVRLHVLFFFPCRKASQLPLRGVLGSVSWPDTTPQTDATGCTNSSIADWPTSSSSWPHSPILTASRLASQPTTYIGIIITHKGACRMDVM